MTRNNPSHHDEEWRDEPDEDEGPDGDDDFDYDEFIDNEFGGGNERTQYSKFVRITVWVLLAISVIFAFVQIGY